MPRSRRRVRDRLWVAFCRLVARVFYRTVEVVGRGNLPATGAAIVCANHTNALADVVVLQSACDRVLHPLARSGLFEKRLLRPILSFIQAVPVYRAQDPGSDTSHNRGSFDRCFELLAHGGVLVLFPEGISHSEPALQPRFPTGTIDLRQRGDSAGPGDFHEAGRGEAVHHPGCGDE